MIPDGRVVFAPLDAKSILLFNPDAETWEEIRNFEGDFEWNSCALLPDGRVVIATLNAKSILFFNPNDKTWGKLGTFEGNLKCQSCAMIPDGSRPCPLGRQFNLTLQSR